MKSRLKRYGTPARSRGLLIAEAVVASFIMIFAFIAAARLFDASLKWEAEANALRTATFVAEKRMEQLRVWAETEFANKAFDDPSGWPSQVIPPTPDPDTPSILVQVEVSEPVYLAPHAFRPAPANAPPSPGLYSPTSHFYSPYPANTQNFQRHHQWLTYPYVRDLSSSCRRVEVTAFFGDSGTNEYKLVALISDPVARPRATTAGAFPKFPVKIETVPPGITSISSSADVVFSVALEGAGGQDIPDVTALWSVDPESTGSVIIRPLDATARTVKVERLDVSVPGSTVRLAAKVRYRGKEIVGYSDLINL